MAPKMKLAGVPKLKLAGVGVKMQLVGVNLGGLRGRGDGGGVPMYARISLDVGILIIH